MIKTLYIIVILSRPFGSRFSCVVYCNHTCNQCFLILFQSISPVFTWVNTGSCLFDYFTITTSSTPHSPGRGTEMTFRHPAVSSLPPPPASGRHMMLNDNFETAHRSLTNLVRLRDTAKLCVIKYVRSQDMYHLVLIWLLLVTFWKSSTAIKGNWKWICLSIGWQI